MGTQISTGLEISKICTTGLKLLLPPLVIKHMNLTHCHLNRGLLSRMMQMHLLERREMRE
jgi:hypothetical protein